MNPPTDRTVGQVVVDVIRAHGVRRAYCVPGESYLGVLEAVRELGSEFDLVVCRHEGGAAYMAEASGRLTGLPGVCMVTRGPGACNAAIGLHTAQHEGTPLILLVGEVTTGTQGRAAFQDIDLQSFYGGMAKKVFRVTHAREAATVMRQAFHLAMAGTPGPVVVGLPEDVQFESVPATSLLPRDCPATAPDDSAVARLLTKLRTAQRPLILVGGTQWTAQARTFLLDFAQRNHIPVASTFRRLDLMANTSPSYVGSIGVVTPPELSTYLAQSDLLLLLGGQLGEIETARYSRLTEPHESRYVVHVLPSAELQGLALQPNLAITSDMEPVCHALASAPVMQTPQWEQQCRSLKAAYENFLRPVQFAGRINPANAVELLSQTLPTDTIVTLGAGNYTHFVLRHHVFHCADSLLAPVCAPMGYSVPAAIAAAMEAPQREVVAYAGDGCFLMNAQELVTAAQRKLRLSVILLNNGIYGSIRMHQELKYPGRPIATDLHNPDFMAYATSMGIPARRVREPDQLVQAWKELRAIHQGPILIEMMTDPEIVAPQRLITRAVPAMHGTVAP